MDKLLAKDVNKGALTAEQSKEARDRISVVENFEEMAKGGVDMVVEVRCNSCECIYRIIDMIDTHRQPPNLYLSSSLYSEISRVI